MIIVLTQRALKFAALTLMRRRHQLLGARLPKPNIFYFAYGANLDPERFKKYQANVEAVGVARLDGFSMKFTLPCEYVGKGFASIEEDTKGTVWGYLYKLDRPTLTFLDACEYAFLRHYVRTRVRVATNDGTSVEAWAYKTPFSTPDLVPSTQYKALILKAAAKHGFPESYCKDIENTPSQSKFELDPGFSLLLPSVRRPLERLLRRPYLAHDKIREVLCEKLRF